MFVMTKTRAQSYVRRCRAQVETSTNTAMLAARDSRRERFLHGAAVNRLAEKRLNCCVNLNHSNRRIGRRYHGPNGIGH